MPNIWDGLALKGARNYNSTIPSINRTDKNYLGEPVFTQGNGWGPEHLVLLQVELCCASFSYQKKLC